MAGTDGCDTWLDAESALFAAADIVPFANNVVKTFGNGAEFEYPGHARADQHPDAGEVVAWPWRARSPRRPHGWESVSHPWVRFGVRRLGRLLVSLWVLVTASFLMIHLIPGDPVRAALGPTAPADLVAAKREELGLNDPLLVQYWHYLQNLFTGDLGTSMISQLPVSQT